MLHASSRNFSAQHHKTRMKIPRSMNSHAFENTSSEVSGAISIKESFLRSCDFGLAGDIAVGMLPFLLVGLLLTSISVYVYTRPAQRKTTVGFLLACLSISEWFFLFIAIPSFSLSQIAFITCSPNPNEHSMLKPITDVFIFPFTHIAKYMCVCISILISAQQWVAVFVPMEVKTWCNMKRTKRLIGFSLVVSIFLTTPKFLERKINLNNWRSVRNKKLSDHWILKSIDYFNDNIFNAFIIFFVLFVINVSIICLLKWSQHERMRLTTQSPRDRRTSLMLFAVLISYVLTHFPSMMIEYGDTFLEDSLPKNINDVKAELSNFFMCCHPLFSFADYLIFSANYRKTVKSLFVRQSSQKQEPTAKKTPLLA